MPSTPSYTYKSDSDLLIIKCAIMFRYPSDEFIRLHGAEIIIM
jgi:hypothetical protein